MTQVIQLQEYQSRVVSLTLAQVAFLRRALSGKMEVWATGEPDQYEIRAGSHVGFVALPGGVTLSIRPKFPVETLFALLAAAYDPRQDIFRDTLQPYSTVEDLFEFVVQIFTTQVEDLLARGILRGYRRVRDDLTAIRGQLLLQETLRRHPATHDRHWCAYSQFTADVPENRILRWATHLLLPYRYREPNLVSRLRRVALALKEIELDPEARRLFAQIAYHRLNNPYRPALELARLLLDHLTFSGTEGREPFLAFLVDMNWLFQEYVGTALSEAACEWGLRLNRQDSHPLDVNDHFAIQPDWVLYQNERPVLVLDAKYKRDAAQGDVYQMLAYCQALGLGQSVLIHPATEQAPAGRITLRGNNPIQVNYLTIDLQGSPQQLVVQQQVLAKNIRAILSSQLLSTIVS